jgi:glutamate-ammonia-ligase adenylyltransferase
LQLLAASAHPCLASPTTREALARLAQAGLLSQDDAAMLIRADRLWRTIQGMLRITYGRAPAEKLSETAQAALLLAVREAGISAVDLATLHATIEATAQDVRAAFIRYVGKIET